MCTYPFGVIIVDDDEVDVEAVSRALLRLPSPPHIVVFRTAGEALQALQTQQQLFQASTPFLILLELNLPVVTGLDFLACVRHDADLRRIPVLVLTDSELDADKETAHKLGAVGFLRKSTAPEDHKAIAALAAALACGSNDPLRSRRSPRWRTHASRVPHPAGNTPGPTQRSRAFSLPT